MSLFNYNLLRNNCLGLKTKNKVRKILFPYLPYVTTQILISRGDHMQKKKIHDTGDWQKIYTDLQHILKAETDTQPYLESMTNSPLDSHSGG